MDASAPTVALARVYTDTEAGRPVQWVVCHACRWISDDQPSLSDAYFEASHHNRRRHPAPLPEPVAGR